MDDEKEFEEETKNIAERMTKAFPLPRDDSNILDSWLSGEEEKLSFDSVSISPSRAKERVVYRDVYPDNKSAPTAAGPSAAASSSSSSQNKADPSGRLSSSSSSSTLPGAVSFDESGGVDELDQLQQQQDFKSKQQQQQQQKRPSQQSAPQLNSHDELTRDINELKSVAMLEPDSQKRNEILGLIHELEVEASSSNASAKSAAAKPADAFQSRMGQYGSSTLPPQQQQQQNPNSQYYQQQQQQQQQHQQQSYNPYGQHQPLHQQNNPSPPPPLPFPQAGNFSNQNDSSMMMMMMMQSQQQQQQQQLQEQRQREAAQQQQQQMAQYMQMFQQQTAALEQENAKLHEELGEVQSITATNQLQQQQLAGFQAAPNNNSNNANGSGNPNLSAPFLSGAPSAAARQVSSNDDMDAAMRELGNSGSVESKRLEKLRIEHLEQMARLRFEAERLEKEAEINAIKEKLEAEKEKALMAAEHEKWKTKQLRQIEAMRIQKAMIREAPLPTNQSNPAAQQQRMDMVYDITSGFKMFWDYAINLPRRSQRQNLTRTRIVYCMYNVLTPFNRIKASKWDLTENSGQNACQAVIGLPKSFDKVSPMLGLKMIMEIQFTPTGDSMSGEQPKALTLGWFAIPVFKESASSGEPVLRSGNFKIPLHPGPFNPKDLNNFEADLEKQQNDSDISGKPTIHFRIRHGAEKVEPLAWDPDTSQHLYKYIFEEQEEATKGTMSKNPSVQQLNEAAPQQQQQQQRTQSPTPSRTPSRTPSQQQQQPQQEGEPQKQNPDGSVVDVTNLDNGDGDDGDGKAEEAEEAEEAEVGAVYDIGLQIHKLDVLPHAKLGDSKPTMSVSVESVFSNGDPSESVFTTKSAKPKIGATDGVFYTYKKNSSFSVTTSESMTELKLSCSSPGFNLNGRLKLLDDNKRPIQGEQQIHLFGSNGGGNGDDEGEPLALLLLSIDEGVGDADKASRTSRHSRRSGSNKKSGKGGKHSLPESVQEDHESEALDLDELSVGSGEKGEEPFIKFENTKKMEEFEMGGDGVDVYVDGCRSLPDNVSVSKVVMKCFAKSGVPVGGDPEIGFSDVTGSVHSPKYTARKEFRSEQIDVTSTIMIRVDTFNPENNRVQGVGYALLNLFCETGDRKKQPGDANSQEYELNTGMFQVPLYKSAPADMKNLTASSCDGKPRVTCATVLLRIVRAPKSGDGLNVLSRDTFEPAEWEKNGLTVPPVEYSSGVYDSTRANPIGAEESLYEQRRQRQEKPLSEYVKKEIIKQDPDKDISTIENSEVEEYVKKNLETNPKSMIDYTFMQPYAVDSGFKFCIDGLHRMTGGGMFSAAPFFKALYLLSPPALFYEDGGMTEDVQFTREYDVESEQLAPNFKDGLFKYTHVEESESLCVIIEVREISTKKKEKVVSDQEQSLWAALPVFRKNSRYVDSGCFCLPIFEGKVPQQALEASDIYEWLASNLKEKKKKKDGGVQLKHGASCIVRLVDSCVEEFSEKVKKHNQVNMNYISAVCAASGKAELIYDYSPTGEESISKPISKLFGKADQDAELKAVNIAMAEATGVKHYIFS